MAVLIIIAVELAVIIGLLAVGECRDEGIAAHKKALTPERDKRAEELEKAWNDGVASILGYDLKTAQEAVRDGGDEE